jgi:hypothetical protein
MVRPGTTVRNSRQQSINPGCHKQTQLYDTLPLRGSSKPSYQSEGSQPRFLVVCHTININNLSFRHKLLVVPTQPSLVSLIGVTGYHWNWNWNNWDHCAMRCCWVASELWNTMTLQLDLVDSWIRH